MSVFLPSIEGLGLVGGAFEFIAGGPRRNHEGAGIFFHFFGDLGLHAHLGIPSKVILLRVLQLELARDTRERIGRLITLAGDNEVDGVAGLHLDIAAVQIAAAAAHIGADDFLAEPLATGVAGAAVNDKAGDAIPSIIIVSFAEIIRELIVKSSLGVVVQAMLQPAGDIYSSVHGGDPAAHHGDVGLRAGMSALRS